MVKKTIHFMLLVLISCVLSFAIEKLVYEFVTMDQVLDYSMFEKTASNPTQTENFVSETFWTLSLPASPKSDTLYIDYHAKCIVYWSGDLNRAANITLLYEFRNHDIIPAGISVYSGMNLFTWHEENLAGNRSLGPSDFNRYVRQQIIPEKVNTSGYIKVTYDTGGDVPYHKAVMIVQRLINEGCEIDFYASGYITGISKINIPFVYFEVSRLVKSSS